MNSAKIVSILLAFGFLINLSNADEITDLHLGADCAIARVKKNYAEAIAPCLKAAEVGQASAQAALGDIYLNGLGGVTINAKKAVYWLRKASDQNYAWGQALLGLAYTLGKGVERNYQTAVYWYRKAAEQGHEAAKKWLREQGK